MNKNIFMLLVAGFMFVAANAQKVHMLTAPEQPKTIYEGGLKLGGTSPDGGSIEVNSYYVSIDGEPMIPITGEFHYSRYPAEQWEQEILKIKAGGVNVIPTYVFWSLHEEREGEFNWEGDFDLRHFVELCGKHDMPVIVRIGPFCHGEIRNGGFPDWLFTKPLDVRSNDPNYLKYVKRLYDEIGKQLEGLYYKDGGPIIGCQIENEHQHSSAPWAINYPGEPKDSTTALYDASTTMVGVGVQEKEIPMAELGNIHMRTLKRMAEEAGIITPLYTATGWGMAAVIDNEAIPVTAAYTYPFWSRPAMSEFMRFKNIQLEPDYSPVRYDTEQFPSFCAEMGVGIQMVYGRRPIVEGKAAEALMVRTLGSGANGIGYYMYHGGLTPLMSDGITSNQEEPMGMPKISYDYQAPLGEFGQEGRMFRNLRLLHNFVNDFSSLLAPMEVVLPENYRQIRPDNRTDLRYAARMKDDSGFVFMVNFQDHDTERIDQTDLVLQLNLHEETLRIPAEGTFTLPKDESVILPFNFNMDGGVLKYATAQLLMKLDDKGAEHYIFFAPEGLSPEYVFDKKTIRGKNIFKPRAGIGSTFSVKTRTGKTVMVTTLTREQALNSSKVNGRILITEAGVLPQPDGVKLLSLGEEAVDYVLYPSSMGWAVQTSSVEEVRPEFTVNKFNNRRMTVGFNDKLHAPQVLEYYLKVDYTGDVGMAFLENELVLDHFYFGDAWLIGLKRFEAQLQREDMSFYFRPLRGNASYLIDLPKEAIPDFSKGPVCSVNSVEVVPEYAIPIEMN